jgi:uncharacterized protein
MRARNDLAGPVGGAQLTAGEVAAPIETEHASKEAELPPSSDEKSGAKRYGQSTGERATEHRKSGETTKTIGVQKALAEHKARLKVYATLNQGLGFYAKKQYGEAERVFAKVAQGEKGNEAKAAGSLRLLAGALSTRDEREARRKISAAAALARSVADAQGSALGIDFLELAKALEARASGSSAIRAPELPKRSGPDGILLLHGFPSSPDSPKNKKVAEELRALGYFVSAPDLNDGDFQNLTVSRAVEQARRCLRERTLVIGSSFGGYVAALLAESDPRVSSMLLLAPAFDLANNMAQNYGGEKMSGWKDKGELGFTNYADGSEQNLSYAFFEDARSHASFPEISVETHIIHGQHDDVVPLALSEEASARFGDNIRLEVVDDSHPLANSIPNALSAAGKILEKQSMARDE